MGCFTLGEVKHFSLESRQFSICEVDRLRELLIHYATGSPQMLYFEAPSRDALSIGIGGPTATVLFIKASKSPPYLSVKGTSNTWNESIEFDMGGTPTPIRLPFCIPVEKAIEISVYFFNHGRIPETEEWVSS